MQIKQIDIQEKEGQIIASVQGTKDERFLTFSKVGENNFLNWFWNQIQVDAHKGNFQKTGGGWR